MKIMFDYLLLYRLFINYVFHQNVCLLSITVPCIWRLLLHHLCPLPNPRCVHCL